MKKLLTTAFLLLITCIATANEGEPFRVIDAEDLPDAAQSFIKRHFGGLYAANSVGVWIDYYGVTTEDEQELNFYMDGSLKEAKAGDRLLPESILNDFASGVSTYINNKYSGWSLADVIVKDSKIEIELVQESGTAYLAFSNSGKLLAEEIEAK